MHLIYENLFKNLLLLWTSNFKSVDHQGQPYVTKPTVWEAIGKATAQAAKNIPSTFGPRLQNIAEERFQYTADALAFWHLYLGPIYLQRQFDDEAYFDHFVELIRLVHICIQFEISKDEVDEVRVGFANWVMKYEELYYQYDRERLPTLPVTIHYLLHIADCIDEMGPVWCYWAFPMERFCGKLGRCIKSRRYPFANLDSYLTAYTQIQEVKCRYHLHAELSLKAPPMASRNEWQIPNPEYSEGFCLAWPRDDEHEIPPGLEAKLASALSTRYTQPNNAAIPLSIIRKYFKLKNVTVWGRLKCLGGGDTIRASEVSQLNALDARDATFIRYQSLEDRNRHLSHNAADEDLQISTDYGQLRRIFVINMPPSKELKIKKNETVVLVEIRRCTKAAAVGPLDIAFCTDLGKGSEIVDLKNVMCLVGRVHWGGRWAMIDRNKSYQAEILDD
ncbi:hypothetical protein BKA70DRAFT_1299413 [Coprinopsis sp. MPI-PUGE-AT-0042]|nr:hypothetical protein BKA70DRAFT_1299413 [Coprinopsis sp. MPI-PUGE-AT-0042]